MFDKQLMYYVTEGLREKDSHNTFHRTIGMFTSYENAGAWAMEHIRDDFYDKAVRAVYGIEIELLPDGRMIIQEDVLSRFYKVRLYDLPRHTFTSGSLIVVFVHDGQEMRVIPALEFAGEGFYLNE